MTTETQTKLTEDDVRDAWFAMSTQQDAAINETPILDWLWEITVPYERPHAEAVQSYEHGVALLKEYRLVRKYVGTVPYYVSETGGMVVDSLSEESPTVILSAGHVATSQAYVLVALRKRS